MQLAHLKVTQAKLGALRPRICLGWTMFRPIRMLDGLIKKPGGGKVNYKLMQLALSLRPVAIPRSKSLVCPIIYSLLEGEELDVNLFWVYYCYGKCIQPSPGIEPTATVSISQNNYSYTTIYKNTMWSISWKSESDIYLSIYLSISFRSYLSIYFNSLFLSTN